MTNPGKVALSNCWGRSFCRNTFFLVLYVYMILINLLSFVLVGAFYASFSIFIRSVMKSSDDPNTFEPANLFENLYLTFLFLVTILSTAIRLEWAIVAFWISSMFMGVFSIIMVVSGLIIAYNDKTDYYAVISISSFALIVILPLIFYMKHIKICEFLKGSMYLIYLAPTYVNILSIYAISNIHNVSWGSRPETKSEKSESEFKKIEKKLEIKYKNFRSNFLIFWIFVNILVGVSVTWSSRDNHNTTLFGIAIFIFSIIAFKLLFSSIYIVSQCWK